MTHAILDKQLIITVNNQIGTLAEITKLLAASGINLVAICAYGVDNKGFVMFVSEDNHQAKALLESKHYDVREEEVLLLSLDNKPGTLQSITEKIAGVGIDVTLIYGSVDKKGKTSRIVVISEDNQAVLMALKTKTT
jgi:hypothetical protein